MPKINFKIVIKYVISISLVIFLLSKIDFSPLKNVGLVYIVPFIICVGINLSALYLMSLRWKILCKKFLGIKAPNLLLYKYYLIGSFFNIFLPGAIGGDVIRTRFIIKKYEIPIKKASLITISERVLGLYGLLLLLGLGLIFRTFPEKLTIIHDIPDYIFYLCFAGIISIIPISKWILKKKDLEVSYAFIIQTIIVLLIAQFGDIVISYVFTRFFDINVPFTALVFIMPLVYLATVLPISLGGLGVREGTFAGLLLLYGAPTSTSILISFSMYIVKVFIGLLGGIIYFREK